MVGLLGNIYNFFAQPWEAVQHGYARWLPGKIVVPLSDYKIKKKLRSEFRFNAHRWMDTQAGLNYQDVQPRRYTYSKF